MKQVLVVMPLDENQKQILEQKAADYSYHITYSSYKEATKAMAEAADVIIGNIPPALISDCTHLELLQLNSAGADLYMREGVLPEGVSLCCASGAYGLSLAEYMVGEILAVKRKLFDYHENQKKQIWREEGSVTSIYGSTTVVWGLGDIGREFSIRMKAMGSHMIGIRRTKGTEKPDYVDEIYTGEELDQILGRADIVAMSLPGTRETRHILNRERLWKLKPDALLMNVGRGDAIDLQALTEVLETGHLGSVILDVTEPEPLPADSPLWHIPRVHITPHIAGKFHLKETVNRIVKIAAENLECLSQKKPLISQVNLKTGYRDGTSVQ